MGIELEIGRINYLGGLTERVKFDIRITFGVIWAMGVKFTLFGCFFNTDFLLYAHRPHGASNRRT